MTLREGTELVLAVGAVLLLARDMHRAWLDQLRRPITLLIGAVVGALLIGAYGGRPSPSPWWLVLPGTILAWEVLRGWRRAPRCHLREAGIGAFAASVLLAAAGFGVGGGTPATIFLATSAVAMGVGFGLLWRSARREPLPWRPGDVIHYERRLADRGRG